LRAWTEGAFFFPPRLLFPEEDAEVEAPEEDPGPPTDEPPLLPLALDPPPPLPFPELPNPPPPDEPPE